MRQTNIRSGREGFALPVALLAMIVIGAVVTGGFYISGQEHNISVGADLGTQALYAAEYGIEERLGLWRNIDLEQVTPGQPYVFPVSNGAREIGSYTVRVMPTGNNVYMLESEGIVFQGQRSARRRAATFVRMGRAAMPYPAAMNVIGSLSAQGNSRIRGSDQCSDDVVPGVVARDTSLVQGGVHAGEQRISGDPEKVQEPGMTADALSRFGEATLADLIASATKFYSTDDKPQNMEPATVTSGETTVCDAHAANNWGDPSANNACSDHYPVIYVSPGEGADSTFQLTTGKGQGILIVDGNLEIQGNFEFSGVVIVTGEFSMKGTGGATGKINGSVLAQGQTVLEEGDNDLSGNALIEFNSCKIEEAFKAALRLKTLPSRGWLVDPSPIPAI